MQLVIRNVLGMGGRCGHWDDPDSGLSVNHHFWGRRRGEREEQMIDGAE